MRPRSELDGADLETMALVSVAVDLLVANPSDADRFAAALVDRAGPRIAVVAAMITTTVADLVEWRTAQGWTPIVLVRLVRRRTDARAAAVVAEALRRQATAVDPAGVAPEWRTELLGLPHGTNPDPTTAGGLRDLLLVIAALRGLPRLPLVVPPPGHLWDVA